MRPFGGIRLSGCLLACRGGKTRRPEVFPHTLICLRTPAESVIASRVKSQKFISQSQTMRKEKNNKPKKMFFFRGRRWSGARQLTNTPPAQIPPNYPTPFGGTYLFRPAVHSLLQSSGGDSRAKRSALANSVNRADTRVKAAGTNKTKRTRRRVGGPRWEATSYTCPVTLEEETPLSFISTLRRRDVGWAGGSVERQEL